MEQGAVVDIFDAPKHVHAACQVDPDRAGTPRTLLPTIAGSIRIRSGVPGGCPFHPRCPDAIPGCAPTASRRSGPSGGTARELLSLSRDEADEP